MNYCGKKNEIIESIVKFDQKTDEEIYVGLAIKTNYDTYKFMISDFRSCCESFGVNLVDDVNNILLFTDTATAAYKDIEKNKHKYLEGKLLLSIEYSHDRSSNEEHCGNFSTKLTLQHGDNTNIYYIDIYNSHNEYYPHTYLVGWNGYKNEGKL